MSSKTILDAKDVRRVLRRMANEIVEANHGTDRLALVGIRTRGAPLARRIVEAILEVEPGADVPVGVLDIALYRDDLEHREDHPLPMESSIDFDIDDRHIVLVDDVLYTGRSVRAALNALCDLGRPRVVRLAVLVDRGRREVPIQPDFTGRTLPTGSSERVMVHLKELDDKDEVLLIREE